MIADSATDALHECGSTNQKSPSIVHDTMPYGVTIQGEKGKTMTQKPQSEISSFQALHRSVHSIAPPLVKADFVSPPFLLPDSWHATDMTHVVVRTRPGPVPGHGRPTIEPLLLLGGMGSGRDRGRGIELDGAAGGDRGRRLARGTGRVGRLVDVFTVDVDGVGDEGGAAMPAAGVALLEPEQLDLGLDALDEAHGASRRWLWIQLICLKSDCSNFPFVALSFVDEGGQFLA